MLKKVFVLLQLIAELSSTSFRLYKINLKNVCFHLMIQLSQANLANLTKQVHICKTWHFPHKIKVRYIFKVLIKFMNSEIKMFSESSKTTCFEAFSFSAFVHTHTDTDQSMNITNKHNRGCDQTEVPLAFILK